MSTVERAEPTVTAATPEGRAPAASKRKSEWQLLFVLVVLAAWPVVALWWRERAILHGDAVLHSLPLQTWYAQALRGSWRFWATEDAFGFPLYAEGTGAFFHPLTWLVFSVLPLVPAHNLLPFLHFAATGLFTFALCRRLALPPAWSLLAGLLVSQSPLVVSTTYNAAYSGTLAWSTAVLWRLEALRQHPDGRRTSKLALAVAAMLLGGYPHVSYATLLFACGILVLEGLRSPRRGGRLLLQLVSATVLGFGIAALQWLPLVELVAESVRSSEVALLFGVPWPFYVRGLLLHDNPSYYVGALDNPWAGVSAGPGSVLALMAIGLLPLMRLAQTWRYLAGVAVLVALGTFPLSPPLAVLREWIPGLDRFRTAGPWLWVALTPLVVCVAEVFRRLEEGIGRWRALAIGTTVPLVVAITWFASRDLVLTRGYAVQLAILGGAASILVVARVLRRHSPARWFPWAIACLAAVEGVWVKQARIPSLSVELLAERRAMLEYLAKQQEGSRPTRLLHYLEPGPEPGPYRALQEKVALQSPVAPNYEEAVRLCRQLLCPYVQLATGVSLLESHNALPLRRRQGVEGIVRAELSGRRATPPGRRLLDRLGVRFVVVYGRATDRPLARDLEPVWTGSFEGRLVTLLENRSALPLGWPVETVEWVADREAMRQALVPRIDGGGPVVAERHGLWHPPVWLMRLVRRASPPADVVFAEGEGEVRSGKRFLAVPPYPGWTAWADDKPLELYPAEGLGMLVEVPPGTRMLEVRFLPWSFFAGLVVTGATTLFLAAVLVRAYRRSSRGTIARAVR